MAETTGDRTAEPTTPKRKRPTAPTTQELWNATAERLEAEREIVRLTLLLQHLMREQAKCVCNNSAHDHDTEIRKAEKVRERYRVQWRKANRLIARWNKVQTKRP